MFIELFLSLVLVYFAHYVVTTYLARRKMPPGPFPYPWIGNIPNVWGNAVNPVGKLVDKYGDIFTLTFPGGDNTVFLNSATLVREARLGNKDDLSGKSPKSIYPFAEVFGNDLITTDYTFKFRFRRRVFKSAMHVFGCGIEQASQRAIHAVDTAIEEIDTKQGEPFSIKELLRSSILIQLWEWLTSKQVQLNDPTVRTLSQFGEILSNLALRAQMFSAIPLMKYLPTQFNRDIKWAQHIRNTLFLEEYQTHKKTYTPGVIRDLTDSFISCYEEEIAKETGKDIGSMEDISGLMSDVMFAGPDTTSTSLAWLFLYVVRHPDVQAKVHKELDIVVGNNRLPNWKDAQDMPYLQATLCEVQRASGMVGIVGTNAIRDMRIAGYYIPKGTFVAINLAKLHHDEREWPEPEEFKPERFLDADGKFVGWTKLHGFLPFSVGRRECPGQSLAKTTMFTFAAILLHRYKFDLPEGEKIPTKEDCISVLIMRPKDFKIVANKREVPIS